MVMDVSNDPVPPSLPAGLDLKVPLPDGFGAAALQSLPLWFRNVDASCFLVALPGALFCSPGLVTFATGPDPVHAELQLARTAVRGFLHVLNLAIEGDASAPACMDEYRGGLTRAASESVLDRMRVLNRSRASPCLQSFSVKPWSTGRDSFSVKLGSRLRPWLCGQDTTVMRPCVNYRPSR